MKKSLLFENHPVEVFELSGKVLFNPYHVGSCLELSESSIRNYLAKMNEKQAVLVKNSDVRDKDIRKLNNAGEKFITESGVYKLVFKSHKPNAEEFSDWVTDEVLPSIRKNGGYIAGQESLTDDELMAKALLVAQNKIAERDNRIASLETEVSVKDQIIGELKPRADYTDKILKNTGLVTMTQIAKDYGMTGQAMNKLLHELGVQYKQSGQWLLYSKYHSMGYTHSETVDIVRSDGRPDVKMNTKWTQKGRLFLYNLLKENGVVPVIEQDDVA